MAMPHCLRHMMRSGWCFAMVRLASNIIQHHPTVWTDVFYEPTTQGFGFAKKESVAYYLPSFPFLEGLILNTFARLVGHVPGPKAFDSWYPPDHTKYSTGGL
jgi:hypothetical protein